MRTFFPSLRFSRMFPAQLIFRLVPMYKVLLTNEDLLPILEVQQDGMFLAQLTFRFVPTQVLLTK
jgi:hypothetical protein